MTTTTTTTIGGVSLLTHHGVPTPEVFEIVLSGGGIDFHRPGRPDATLTWDRVSDWVIDERGGDLVLTLEQGGTDTALLISGWSAADLGALLQRLSDRPPAAATAPDQVREAGPPEGGGASSGVESPRAVESSGVRAKGGDDGSPPTVHARHRRSRRLVPWKAVVTIVLLGVLATAVTIVLLQSAGVISWSILGPTS